MTLLPLFLVKTFHNHGWEQEQKYDSVNEQQASFFNSSIHDCPICDFILFPVLVFEQFSIDFFAIFLCVVIIPCIIGIYICQSHSYSPRAPPLF